MTRVGSLLMILLLAAPIVGECCLPVAVSPPCHASKPTEELSCAANQAIPEANAALSVRPVLVYGDAPVTNSANSAHFVPQACAAAEITIASSPPHELYLLTGALLI